MSVVRVRRRDGTVVEIELESSEVAHRVNAQGLYQGLVADAPGLTQVPGAPPAGAGWLWDFGQALWLRPLTPAQQLAAAKAARIHEIRMECLARVQVLYSGIDTFGALEVILGLWTQGLAAVAKAPQGDWAQMLQIVNAARQGIADVRAATSPAGVAAVVVAWP